MATWGGVKILELSKTPRGKKGNKDGRTREGSPIRLCVALRVGSCAVGFSFLSVFVGCSESLRHPMSF